SGSYYLIFVTDRLNYVFESDKSNNIAIVPITFIVTPPDLAPIGLQVPSVLTGPPNLSLSVAWGVANQGIGLAQMNNAAWWDVLYFSADAVLDPFDVALASQAESGPLAPGESYQRTNMVHLPVVYSTNCHLIFKTDVYDVLSESNETNNTLAVPLAVNILPPDLAPIAFIVPNAVTSAPRPNLSFVWGVTNQGIGVADPGNYWSWSDSVYLSSNSVLDNTAQLVGGWSESTPIPAGGSYWRTNGF